MRSETSKTNFDVQHNKLGIRVASRVVKQLKTRSQEIRLYQKNLKFASRRSLVPSLPLKDQTLAIAVKKHAKKDIKPLLFRPILLDFSILSEIFCPELQFLKICNYEIFPIYISFSLILQNCQKTAFTNCLKHLYFQILWPVKQYSDFFDRFKPCAVCIGLLL